MEDKIQSEKLPQEGPGHTLPGDIERTSLAIISDELNARGIALPAENEAVVKRVIHATADFDYAENLHFTEGAVARGIEALRAGRPVITDTEMALAGISRMAMSKLGLQCRCYMADEQTAQEARRLKTTRAAVSMTRAMEEYPGAVLAVGNGPTACLKIAELMEEGARPALVIGVPVGFVNVVESKKILWETCKRLNVPAIVSMGRKGGSTVSVAICNALLYQAAMCQDPADRGWM